MIVPMTYRPTSRLRNILPVAILLPAAVAVGCAGTGCAPGAPPAERAARAEPAAKAAPIRFEPAKGDHSDLAVGETVVERLALVADAPTDWNALAVATSCECMSARFLDRSDPKRAWIEVTYLSDKLEDIDGMLTAMDAQRRDVARYEAKVVAKRKPFVQPRKVVLEAGGTPRFEIVMGQAFRRGEKLPDFLLDSLATSDDSLVALVAPPEETKDERADRDSAVMLCRLAFEPNEAARAKQGSVKITLRFGAPVVERVVEASWPGSH